MKRSLGRVLALAAILAIVAGLSAARAGEFTTELEEKPSGGQSLVHTDFIGEGGAPVWDDPAMSDSWESGALQSGADLSGGNGPTSLPASDLPAGASNGSPSGSTFQPNPPPFHRVRGGQPVSQQLQPTGQGSVLPDISRSGSAGKAAVDRREGRSSSGDDSSRYNLWQGLSKPLILPAGKVKQGPADEATSLGRRDYNSHILGASDEDASAFSSPGPANRPLRDALGAGSSANSGRGKVFVTLNIKPRPGALKDAVVADLGRTAAFALDARFAGMTDAAGGGLKLSGWLPADRLGALLKNPEVTRAEVARSAGRLPSGRSPAEKVLLGVRVHPGESPNDALDKAIDRLSDDSGFRLAKTVGSEPIPHSRDRALLVVGEVPLNRLSSVMASPSVIKFLPLPDRGGRTPLSDAERSQDFLSFVWSRFPILLIATFVILVPAMADLGTRVAETFVPYRAAGK